jgi:hypothetical protein
MMTVIIIIYLIQLRYGSKDFVSGHTTYIAKPIIPDFRIAALKGTHQVNPAIVTQVDEPFPMERRVKVPYDVPIVREQIRSRYAQGAFAAGPIEGAYAATPIAATHF